MSQARQIKGLAPALYPEASHAEAGLVMSPSSPSAFVEQIARRFSLTDASTDLHGAGLREQLLTSYVEWLAMEQRIATSELSAANPELRHSAAEQTRPGSVESGGADPIITLIENYHAACRSYGREILGKDVGGEGEAYDHTLGRATEALRSPSALPTTVAGAIECLRFGVWSDAESHSSDMASEMAKKTIAFLEDRASAAVLTSASGAHRAQLDPSSCIVAQIGRLCAELNDAFTASEVAERAARDKGAPGKLFIEETREHISDREYNLRQSAPHLLAQSLEGAMFQVAVASHLIDDVLSLDINDPYEKLKAEQRLRGAESCLYSVLRVLEAACGTDRRTVGAAGSMSDFRDPHTRVERALRGHHEMDPRRMTEDEAPYPPTAVRSIFSSAARDASKPAVATAAPGVGAPEVPGSLLPLMLAYEQATAAFNACGSDHPANSQLDDAQCEACRALTDEIRRGTDCLTVEEAKVATRIAVKEYDTGDNEIAAGLALAALAVFLGSEAVS
jgi:hypothetical protein